MRKNNRYIGEHIIYCSKYEKFINAMSKVGRDAPQRHRVAAVHFTHEVDRTRDKASSPY